MFFAVSPPALGDVLRPGYVPLRKGTRKGAIEVTKVRDVYELNTLHMAAALVGRLLQRPESGH